MLKKTLELDVHRSILEAIYMAMRLNVIGYDRFWTTNQIITGTVKVGDDSHLFDSYRCIWLRLLFQHTCVPDSGDVVYDIDPSCLLVCNLYFFT